MILAATADSPEFNALLQRLGINKVVAVTELTPTALDSVSFDNG